VGQFDEQIAALCGPFEDAITRLDTIPGVARQTAEIIVSEIGLDTSRFLSAAHLAAWAGVVPKQPLP
jgi:transposase